jgi:hypothetical protein
MLNLSKWYLDVVTDDGTVLVAYALSIQWAALRVDAASVLLADPGSELRERRAWSNVRAPRQVGDSLRFCHEDLRIDGDWRRLAPPIEASLLDDESGRVSWACAAPCANVSVRLDGRTFTGKGYAECLTMTRLPWTLPLRHLRWGRFTGESHSVVWIAWRGGPPRQWVWLDGMLEPAAESDDGGVTGLGDGRALCLAPVRDICDRRSLRALLSHAPALESGFAGPLRDLRDAKRLARGRLVRDGAVVDEGWTIHEVVTW